MAELKLTDVASLITEKFQTDLQKEFEEIVPDVGVDKAVSIYEDVFINGKQQTACRCSKCGETYFTGYPLYGKHACLKCGEITQGVRVGDTISYTSLARLFVKKIADGFIIARYYGHFKHVPSGDRNFVLDGENAFLNANFRIEYRLYRTWYFSKKYGCRGLHTTAVTGENRLTNNTDANSRKIAESLGGNIVITEEYKELAEILGISMNENQEHADAILRNAMINYNHNLRSKKEQTTKKKEEFVVEDYEIPTERILDAIKNDTEEDCCGKIFNISGNEASYNILCSCGNVITGTKTIDVDNGDYKTNSYARINLETECPCCGRKIEQEFTSNSSSYSQNKKYFHSYFRAIDGNLVCSIYNTSCNLHPKEDEKVITPPYEVKRVYFTPKKIMVYLKEFGNKEDSWSKGTVRDLYAGSHSWYSMNASDLLNTDAELEEAISNSCLKQSGLIQAWGLGNYSSFRIEEKGYIKQTSYIAQYYKRPYLEIIMKSGLKQITKDYMNGHFELWKPKKDEEAKTDIYSVLNLSKGAFKIARADDLSYDDANVVRQCYKYQSNFDINMWHELVNLHENARINISQFISICERTHTSYKRMMEYLQSCYDNQCIEKSNALSIYGDYYNMAEKVGFNLADKAIKFPNSLKKEHDKATFAYKVVENEVKLKEFKKHSEENKKYEFENKKYKVIVPMTPNEVVHEGQVQQHCVASYVNQIERGSTVICFLREKENVDKAFYTCEILNGELYQVKGFCNKYPPKSDEELMNFIQKWTDAKGLVQSYRYH